ncbi:hypothetical protein D7Y27_36545 [Corallococcus sp. AB004]|nr:hypothetical protein D7Y27_36545 [Corallococcus sp. AB004]
MQTTIPQYQMERGFPGQLAEHDTPQRIVSRFNAEATAAIPWGVLVAEDTASAQGVKLLAAATDKVAGVTVYSARHGYEAYSGTGLKPKEILNVLAQGAVLVRVEQAVVKGDRAFARFAGTGQKGAFRKDADTANAVELKGAMYLTSAAANGIAVLLLDANTIRAGQT